MKSGLLAIVLFTALFSCKDSGKTESHDASKKMDNSNMVSDAPEKDFSNVQFAINKDSICGMPLTAGISDTAIVDGKIYGFCSPECKETFLAEAGHKH